ncbi:hypothetical protein B0I35DRAFT_22836 [Stachybotrys elegans]|uniref:Heterokaryon incompatibility domain-containing protein n=1 Tax=Stachybotrys elegans TaxID=80388 RepID=A0A8K0WXL5_9HYPO|nr:hypothetical protein B0I35DRAFT_22836 [Stachybotrys elegans]
MLRLDPGLVEQMKLAAPDLGIISGSELTYIRKLSYFRSMVSRGNTSEIFPMRPNIGPNSPGMLETAVLARDLEATDGRDKIFALWNLAQDNGKLDFKMDYTQSIPSSFKDFVTAWSAQHKSLVIIAVSECNERSKAFYEEAPSWCPDWTAPSAVSCLVRRDWLPVRQMLLMDSLDGELYKADGGMKNEELVEPLFEFYDNTLLCTGVIIDEVQDFLVMQGDGLETHRDIFYAFVRYVTDEYSSKYSGLYDDARQAAWAMCHGDVPSAWLPREQSQFASDRYPLEDYVCEQERSRFLLKYAGGYDRPEAWDTVKMSLRGRQFALSRKGYMCLVPQELSRRTGVLHMAIIATCSVPVLLEAVDEASYRFVGSCFVQGWMEGEVFAACMDVGSPREYWEVNHDSSKLLIV